MLLGIISDVHANLPALHAVIDDAPSLDMIIHAGDVVGYNPYPSRVIAQFQKLQIDSIQGNHDTAVLNGPPNTFSDDAAAAIYWTTEKLNEQDRSYLRALPREHSFTVDETEITVVHGFIDSTNEYVYPTEITMDHFERVDNSTDILIYGHTHYPLITRVNGTTLLNPGSVGQPRDGDWRPSYAVLDTETATVCLHRCRYNVEKVINLITDSNLPTTIATKLRSD